MFKMTSMARFCLVCFKLVKSGKELDDVLMTKLNNLDLQKYVDNQDNPVICSECLEKITNAFDFKSKCLLTEKHLISHSSLGEDQIELKLLFSQRKLTQNVSDIKNLEMCRLCLNLVDTIRIRSLVQMMENADIIRIFQKHIPEINLQVVKNPLVCEECQNSLLNFTDLIFLLKNINNDEDITPALEASGLKLIKPPEAKPNIVCDTHNDAPELCAPAAEEDHTDIANYLDINIKSEPIDEIDNFTENGYYENDGDVNYFDVRIKSEPIDNTDITVESVQIENEIKIKNEPEDETNFLQKENVYDFAHFLDVKIKEEPVDETENLEYANVKIKEENDVNASENSEINASNVDIGIKPEVKCEPTEKCPSINKRNSHSTDDLAKKLSCKRCNFRTNYYYSLKRHQLRHQYILRKEKLGKFYQYIYQCGKCSYKTNNPKSFQQHMPVHQNSLENLQQCELCDFKTKLMKNLKRHVITTHFEYPPPLETCQICDLKTKYLNVHMAGHLDKSDGSYKCEFCDYKTNQVLEIKTHAQSKHMNRQNGTFKCETCGLEVKHKKSLKKHILFKHTKENVEQFNCEQCSYKTTIKRHMERHIKVHDRCFGREIHRCKICTYNTVSIQYLKYHIESKHRNLNYSEMATYNCAMCNYKTKVPHYLRRHLKKHTNPVEKIRVCELCSYRTRSSTLLAEHVQTIHKTVKTEHTCELCDFTTDELGKLKYHIWKHSFPSQIKMLKCDLCSYQTMEGSLLIDHKLKHHSSLEHKVMQCDKCTFQTRSSAYFKFHVESGHENSTITPHTPLKLKKLNDSSDLKKPDRKYGNSGEIKGLKCELCDFRTNELYKFRHHVLKHTISSELKTFQCRLCPYQTNHRKNLEMHRKNHQTTKNYKCHLCSYRTVSVQFLKQHLLAHKNSSYLQTLNNDSKNKHNYIPSTEFNKHLNEVKKNGQSYFNSPIKVIDSFRNLSTG